jgi:hypothetical protein
MDSNSLIAKVAAPSLQKVWALPELGLTIFHGQAHVPRLFHYFLPRLITQGKPVLCLDGANCFDPLLIARFATQRGHAPSVFNKLIRVSRAFTCFQLMELILRAPKFLKNFSANVLFATAVPDLFFDEDVRESEARASFAHALEGLETLASLSISISVFSDATSFKTRRMDFFPKLCKQANQVLKIEASDNKFSFTHEKTPPLLSQ